MPEYLAPGVFIEEIPARLKAIEGVSTSTAAFVGAADRGPVPGFPLPFLPTEGLLVPTDPAPLLVTSFADFTREFGDPLPLPDVADNGYLAYAARAFFENGGKRLYVCRVVKVGGAAGATRGSAVLQQGVILRLVRPVKGGTNKAFFASLRGVNSGASLTFLRRSNDTNALALPAQPAVLVGTGPVQPFALANGDTLSVAVSAGAPVTATIQAAPIELVTAGPGPFVGVTGKTLGVQVAALPAQTVTFTGDTATQVALDIAANILGVEVSVDAGGKVHILSDHRGSAAALSVASGTAATTLAFAAAPAGANNVADADSVTAAEIAAIFAASTPPFVVDSDAAGHLRFTTTATGSGVTIAFTTSPLSAKLGLGTATTGSGGGAPVSPVVASYDTKEGSVTFNGPIPSDLDPGEVYAVITAPTANGPKFWARSPGSWSQDVSLLLTPSDRAAVPVTEAAASGTTVQLQSVTSFYVGAVLELDHDGSTRSYHQVTAIAGRTLSFTPPLSLPIANPTRSFARVVELDITVIDESGASPVEVYKGLSWARGPDSDLRRHYASVINSRSRLVYVQPPGIGTPPLPGTEGPTLDSMPTTRNGFAQKLTALGNDGLPSSDEDYVGIDAGPGQRSGVESLQDIDDARIIAAPGRTGQTVQNALISQCERMRYRFAVLDSQFEPTDVTTILAHRNAYDSSFAAYYTPWVKITQGDAQLYLPPSGHIAGIYARVDVERGVYKAPANEVVRGITGLRSYLTTGEQEILNPRGVDAIRRFEGRGLRVWGARTLSSDPEFRYVNVRRFLIFLEASLDRGTQYVVFEPNAPPTWSRVVDSISAFLHTQWRDGALFGRRPEDAFFVRCDETTMSVDDVQNGRLICQIGVAIVRPAEFVIFRIEQISGFGKNT